MTRCDSALCWCAWPPVRRVQSTGQRYTVEEVGLGLYRYFYFDSLAAEVWEAKEKL